MGAMRSADTPADTPDVIIAGADGHLTKPILAEDLLNLVAEVAAGLAEASAELAA